MVLEPEEDPVPRLSAVNLDSVESVSIGVLVERIGRLSDDRMREVCVAPRSPWTASADNAIGRRSLKAGSC